MTEGGGQACIPDKRHELLVSVVRAIEQLPRVEHIYLFGSYAMGTQSPDSDVDLAVFFDSEKDKLLDEYRTLVGICRNAELDIQVQVFQSAELEEPCGIIEEIVTNGIELHSGGDCPIGAARGKGSGMA